LLVLYALRISHCCESLFPFDWICAFWRCPVPGAAMAVEGNDPVRCPCRGPGHSQSGSIQGLIPQATSLQARHPSQDLSPAIQRFPIPLLWDGCRAGADNNGTRNTAQHPQHRQRERALPSRSSSGPLFRPPSNRPRSQRHVPPPPSSLGSPAQGLV
jgi:hypothetical protein